MARPMKCRRVSCAVPARYYKPQGVPLCELEEVELALDEVEAMRLTDIEDLYQADAAQRMGVSRQTLGNIIARAHKKVAIALLEGKALRIVGRAFEESSSTGPEPSATSDAPDGACD
jgi:predicted DNA-binding protein (UPF0251 family)